MAIYKYSNQNKISMASGLSINQVAITIVAISIGLVLIGSLLAPVASDVMAQLTATEVVNGSTVAVFENGESWSSLIGVVVIVAIIGLVVVAINSYTKN